MDPSTPSRPKTLHRVVVRLLGFNFLGPAGKQSGGDLGRMSKPSKSAGKGKRKGKPQRKSGPHTKQTQKAKSGRGTRRRGRGKSHSSSSSSSSNSSSGDDEPAPAPAPAPADDDSSDAESSSDDDELDQRLRREYYPEGMLAGRALEREKRRRERMGAKRRRKADKEPLPAVPADPFPPQFGGFPTDWPDEGFPGWFAEKAKAMGHDLDDARNVAALKKMVEACRRVNVRPLMQGRFISPTRSIKNFELLAEREDGERAAELKAAAKSLRDLREECRQRARPAEPPRGCCRMCAVIGAVLRGNQPVVRGPPRRRVDAVTGSRRWRGSPPYLISAQVPSRSRDVMM